MTRLRHRWNFSLGRIERGWILFCSTGTFVLLVVEIVTNGHL